MGISIEDLAIDRLRGPGRGGALGRPGGLLHWRQADGYCIGRMERGPIGGETSFGRDHGSFPAVTGCGIREWEAGMANAAIQDQETDDTRCRGGSGSAG